MTTQALDDDYERLVIRPVGWAWMPVWDWARLRYTVRACVVSPWQIGQPHGSPLGAADPEAALDAAAPLFVSRQERQLSATTSAVIALLREGGPLSATVIAARMGCARSTITGCIGNHADLFERVGWASGRHMLYRLRDERG